MLEGVPEEFWQGVAQFNQGEFYACHDTLEVIWIEAPTFEKNFYQGILQIAVSLYHLGNDNWRGAVILLGEGLSRLRKYPAEYAGIDVDDLIAQSADLLSALQATGAERVADVVLMSLAPETNASSETGKIILRQPTIQKLVPSV